MGYEYIVIDDCWMTYWRQSDSHLGIDEEKFPSGMAALSSKLNEFKIGVTSSASEHSCSGS